MGTRSLTCVQLNNEYKVAQYGQLDGYPRGQGLTVLKFLKNNDLSTFKQKLESVKFMTEDEYDIIIKEHTDNGHIDYKSDHGRYWEEHLSHIDRNLGAQILQYIVDFEGDELKLLNQVEFANYSLFCEYAYVIDLDKNVLEVYRGFNKLKLPNTARFYTDTVDDDGYYPIVLWKTFDLNNLPTESEFLSVLTDEEENE